MRLGSLYRLEGWVTGMWGTAAPAAGGRRDTRAETERRGPASRRGGAQPRAAADRGRGFAPGGQLAGVLFSMGTLTMLPHSVQDPS